MRVDWHRGNVTLVGAKVHDDIQDSSSLEKAHKLRREKFAEKQILELRFNVVSDLVSFACG